MTWRDKKEPFVLEESEDGMDSIMPETNDGTWPSDYNKEKLSKAVIVRYLVDNASGDEYALLHWIGYDLDYELNENGFSHPCDLGIQPKEPGIWLWEGRSNFFTYPSSPNSAEEYDSELVGEFRKLTTEEMEKVCNGIPPWNVEDYLKEK